MNLVIVDNVRDQQLQRISEIKDNYSSQVKSWIKWLRETGNDINSNSIREYFQELEKSGYKARTIANKRAAVKKRIRQLFKDAGTEFNMKLEHGLKEIDQEIRPPKINSEAVETDKVLTKQEYDQLINKCRTDRQKAFIKFLMATGCRVNELTGIELKDCDNQGYYVIVTVLGKGKKERDVKISIDLYDYIQSVFKGSKYLFETQGGKRYLNDYISKQIKKQGVKIGRKISAHSCRHSWFTEMVRKHPDKIDAISRMGGHSHVSITLSTYVHTKISNSELFELWN